MVQKELLEKMDDSDICTGFMAFDGIIPDANGDETIMANAIQSEKDATAEFDKLAEADKTAIKTTISEIETRISTKSNACKAKMPGALADITPIVTQVVTGLKGSRLLFEAEKVKIDNTKKSTTMTQNEKDTAIFASYEKVIKDQ
jgi:hypothetical protein